MPPNARSRRLTPSRRSRCTAAMTWYSSICATPASCSARARFPDVANGTYPKASADGTYQYQATISLKALQAAFAKAFGDQQLDLDRRVVFIHGVPSTTKLPASVASLGPIPAQLTLPIACGKIERDQQ